MAWKKRGETSDGGKFPGGTWHIFHHVIKKSFEDGEIVERKIWRAVICTHNDNKLHWKASNDKEILKKWVKDKTYEYRELKPPKERKTKISKKRNKENALNYITNLYKNRKR